MANLPWYFNFLETVHVTSVLDSVICDANEFFFVISLSLKAFKFTLAWAFISVNRNKNRRWQCARIFATHQVAVLPRRPRLPSPHARGLRWLLPHRRRAVLGSSASPLRLPSDSILGTLSPRPALVPSCFRSNQAVCLQCPFPQPGGRQAPGPGGPLHGAWCTPARSWCGLRHWLPLLASVVFLPLWSASW